MQLVLFGLRQSICSKEFFDCYKQHKFHTQFLEFTEGKKTLNSPNDLNEYIFQYYKVIYSRDKKVHANHHQRMQYFSSVYTSITKEQNAMFTMEISNLEVHAIIKAFPTHKVVSDNGLATEIFGMLLREIGANVTKFLSKTFEQGVMDQHLNTRL